LTNVLENLLGGIMATKGTPKQDGSGKGTRQNKGRGGCVKPQKSGQGKRK
jgi:hypothetical protein